MHTSDYIAVSFISCYKFIELILWAIVKNPQKKTILSGASGRLGVWHSVEMLISIPWTFMGLIAIRDYPDDRSLGYIFTAGGVYWIATAFLSLRWRQKTPLPSATP